jgi:hypothetical protein
VRFFDKGKPTERIQRERGISVSRSLAKLKAVKPPIREALVLPDTLRFKQQGGADHFEIVPTNEITWSAYKAEVRKIKLGPTL